jgi:hypothetical protein
MFSKVRDFEDIDHPILGPILKVAFRPSTFEMIVELIDARKMQLCRLQQKGEFRKAQIPALEHYEKAGGRLMPCDYQAFKLASSASSIGYEVLLSLLGARPADRKARGPFSTASTSSRARGRPRRHPTCPLRGSNPDLRVPVYVSRVGPRSTTAALVRGDAASDGGVAGAADRGSIPVGHGADLFGARQ